MPSNRRKEFIKKFTKIDPVFEKHFRVGLNYLGYKKYIPKQIQTAEGLKIVEYKENEFFQEGDKRLPIPYVIGECKLPKHIMDLYNIKTEVDLAIYLRIVAIQILKFKGPKENDHLDYFIKGLRKFFQNMIFQGEGENYIISAIFTYDIDKTTNAYFERLRNIQSYDFVDYVNFAGILNKHFKLCFVTDTRKSFASKHDSFTIERLERVLKDEDERESIESFYHHLVRFNIIDSISLNEFIQLSSTSDYRNDLLKKIRALAKEVLGERSDPVLNSYRILFCDKSEEELLEKIIQNPSGYFSMINVFNVCPVKTKAELEVYVKNPDNRAKLVKKIITICKREFGEFPGLGFKLFVDKYESITIEKLGQILSLDITERYSFYKNLEMFKIIEKISYDEFKQHTSKPEYRINLLKTLRAFLKKHAADKYGTKLSEFKEKYCNVTQEELYQLINYRTTVKKTYEDLKYFLLIVADDYELFRNDILNPRQGDNVHKLLKRIQNFCKREFGE